VSFYGSAALTATVVGTALPTVNWLINSGGGSLSATTGASVTYTAPLVQTATQVTIYAVSTVDQSKFGSFTLTVTPPPPPGRFLNGTISGTEIQEPWSYDQYQNKIYGQATTLQNTDVLTTIDDSHVALSGGLLSQWSGLAQAVFTATPDGKFTWYSPASGVLSSAYNAQLDVDLVFPPSGTWDYHGNITLTYTFNQEICGVGCGDSYWDVTISGTLK
jgi:hypothetical protein